jgi:hypothetical protein
MISQLLTSFLLVVLFQAPESTIQVVDKSSPASPIAISGIAIAPNTQAGAPPAGCKAKLTLRNVSTKPIVVSVIHLEVNGRGYQEWNLTHQEDNFYSDRQLEPGAPLTIESAQKPLPQQVAAPADERVPKAIASVQYVEFLDGSTWGDPLVRDQVRNERQIHLQNLKELWQVYQTGGDPELEIALSKPFSDDAVGVLQAMYRDTNNLRIVTDKLAKMLAMAEAHTKGMSAPSQ